MKKYFIGVMSIFLLLASILGMQTKGTKDQRSGRPNCGSGPALWI